MARYKGTWKSYMVGWSVAMVAGVFIGYYCLPPIINPDIARAIEIVRHSRDSHIFAEGCEPIDGSEWHKQIVRDYEFVLGVLRTLR